MRPIQAFLQALSLSLALSPAWAETSTAPAPAPGVANDWCVRDAPGLWRDLRAAARGSGATAAPDCPAPEPVTSLPRTLVIPLPCDRSLVLARVDISAATVLDHTVARIGGVPNEDLRVRYTQGMRRGAVSGAYSIGATGGAAEIDYSDLRARAFYIAAYEWTELQHAVFASGALDAWGRESRPAISENDSLCSEAISEANETRYSDIRPQAGVSWFEAVAIVRALNAYVTAESNRRIAEGTAPLVPWEQGSPGFFRLPSEAEWEFAARGGASADTEAAQSPLYLVRSRDGDTLEMGEIGQLASFADGSTREKLSGVGAKAPNLLGLYDTIGNAGEIVHDLFGLTRPDMPHGALGGYTVRGGNALTPTDMLGIAHRQEIAFYDASGETASPFVGVRLMLTPPILTSGSDGQTPYRTDLANTDFLRALEAAHADIVTPRQTAGAAFRDEARGLLAELRASGGSAADPALLARIARIETALEQSETAINEARDAELRANVRAATTAILNIHANSTLGVSIQQLMNRSRQQLEDTATNSQRKTEMLERLDNMQLRLDELLAHMEFQTRYVLALARDLARADPVRLDAILAEVRQSNEDQRLTLYIRRAWPLFDQAMADMRAAPDADHYAKYIALFDTQREIRATIRNR